MAIAFSENWVVKISKGKDSNRKQFQDNHLESLNHFELSYFGRDESSYPHVLLLKSSRYNLEGHYLRAHFFTIQENMLKSLKLES